MLKRSVTTIVTLLVMIPFTGFFAQDQKGQLYREHVRFHTARTSFIAGETVWYKAYCKANNNQFKSKALYVELVDHNKKSVLGQIVKISNDTAASSMVIPDTLSSGEYTLIAYTQWMRNFDEDLFAREHLIVYNPYDNSNGSSHFSYELAMEPNIFIEGGQMLDSVPSRIMIELPTYFGEPLTGRVLENSTNREVARFDMNGDNQAVFEFIPVSNYDYKVEMGDSVSPILSVSLPSVKNRGHVIRTHHVSSNQIEVQLYAYQTTRHDLTLYVSNGHKTISQESLSSITNGAVIKMPLTEEPSGTLEIVLEHSSGKILARQPVYHKQVPKLKIRNLNSTYSTNEEVNINFKPDDDHFSLQHISIGVHKNFSQNERPEYQVGLPSFDKKIAAYPLNGSTNIYLPKVQNDKNEDSFFNNRELLIHPVEDIGILYSGKIKGVENLSSSKDIEVRLSLANATGTVLSGKLGTSGEFAFLIDEYGAHDAYIDLIDNGKLWSNGSRARLNEKFHFIHEDFAAETKEVTTSQEVTQWVEDESKRVLIQRAFNQNENGDQDTLNTPVNMKTPFYGEPETTVYPDKFFDLPNFEEITREILPRVRYKRSKDGCTMVVFNPEGSFKSGNPLVLLDGIPVYNLCELYELTSGDINRVEIQSDERIAGNLFYDGLVAIYSSDSYKEEMEERRNDAYQIKGYQPEVSFLDSYDVTHDDAGQGTTPDFRNLLYWDPSVSFEGGKENGITFHTSDEEGEYIMRIIGYTSNNEWIEINRTFKVEQEKATR